MTNTKSLIKVENENGLLNGGDFGFDITHKRLYAGFGLTNEEIVLKSGDTGWLPIMLQNEWEIEGEAPGYRIDSSGVVHLKGTVKNGNLNQAVCQLPLKPSRNISKIVPLRSEMGRVDINTDGYIIARGSNQYEMTQDPTEQGALIEVSFLSLEMSFML